MRKALVAIGLAGLMASVGSASAFAQGKVEYAGKTTVFSPRASEAELDYAHAMPMDMPSVSGTPDATADMIEALTAPHVGGSPGVVSGEKGSGYTSPASAAIPSAEVGAQGVEPQEFGTAGQPFSTARADLLSLATNTKYPYRPAGRLFFNVQGGTAWCSASLIKRGVIVTAAHCVANFGQSQFYSGWKFVPGYRLGATPFLVWTANVAIVMTSYFNGTDPCVVAGVICQNDVAVIRLNTAPSGAYPGTATGWYGYGWNGFGFTAGKLTNVTQLGYPACLDNALRMQRNDSYGFNSASLQNNTLIGSLMCGGSSGGPWLVNFGIRPVLTGTTNGIAPNPNIVVGVTGWGYVSPAVKRMGASPFTSGNIVPLVAAACPALHPACL